MDAQKLLNVLIDSTSEINITISLNTHRTLPDNQKDAIKLKNFISEAKKRLLEEFNQKDLEKVLRSLDEIQEEVDVHQNLDALHIFVSNTKKEIFRSGWSTDQEGVHISRYFAVKPLIKEITRLSEYGILLLSAGSAELLTASNDAIVKEVDSDVFPVTDNPFLKSDPNRQSDSKYQDERLAEFFNLLDKAINRIELLHNVKVVVVASEDNYTRLMQVADQPKKYIGHISLDQSSVNKTTIGKSTWDFMKAQHKMQEESYFAELEQAVGSGLILTDLQEIYQACLDGRADLLILEENFKQSAKLQGEREISLENSTGGVDVIDDLGGFLAWKTFEKNGRFVLVNQIPNPEFRPIVLKVRY